MKLMSNPHKHDWSSQQSSTTNSEPGGVGNETTTVNNILSHQDREISYPLSCPFLDLPYELREKIYKFCFGSPVIYLRSKPCTKPPKQFLPDYRWQNHPDWQNQSPGLFLLNNQIRSEALKVFFQHSVLDFWGFGNLREVFKIPPSFALLVKNLAVSNYRRE